MSDIKTNCIKRIFSEGYFRGHQCFRKRGHGKDGLYCKQHDPERVAERYKKREEKWNAKLDSKKITDGRNAAYITAFMNIAKDDIVDSVAYAKKIVEDWK